MSIHQKQLQIIAYTDKPLSERIKEAVEYFQSVDAENFYFSFNGNRPSNTHTCTVTISYSGGENETFSVDF